MQTLSETLQLVLCAFCGLEDNEKHQCRADLFNVLNSLGKQDKENAFNGIENLVFQGGGVKGIAYVGTFRALFDNYNLRDQIKRVAGSSAGAIAALYVSLGLSTTEIANYLETNLFDKLDDQPTVTVEGTVFPIRLVFQKVLDFYGNHTKQDIMDLVSDMLSNILKTKFGWTGSIASYFGSDKIGEMVANYVFNAPSEDNLKTIAERVYELEQEIKQEEIENDNKAPMPRSFFSWSWPWSPKEKPTLEQKDIFHAALSQILEQTFFGPNPDFADGWFAAEKIKEDLIVEPIRKAYQNFNKSELFDKDLTFSDLASVTVDGKPVFKKLYVTAFNSATGKTEIFSVDHTPNVVVADAVRASMSIPVFFKVVPIRERVGEKKYAARQVFISPTEFKNVDYMDGGIMDNYAMWIFDDLQYCIGESFAPSWIPIQKIAIRNPKTLGVKLVSSEQRKLYLHPYVDEKRIQLKVAQLPEAPTPMKLISRALLSDSQENTHLHRGDASRTIYVDNLGVTAISFNLKPEELKDFEKAGELGVRQYLNYFRWGKLSMIGENYAAIKRSEGVAPTSPSGK